MQTSLKDATVALREGESVKFELKREVSYDVLLEKVRIWLCHGIWMSVLTSYYIQISLLNEELSLERGERGKHEEEMNTSIKLLDRLEKVKNSVNAYLIPDM